MSETVKRTETTAVFSLHTDSLGNMPNKSLPYFLTANKA